MDSNNLYQNQQSGTEPDNNQTGNAYQSGDACQTGNTYQNNDVYQAGNAYQSGDSYQSDSAYQQPVYNQYDQGNSYNNGNYANGSYSNGNYNGGNGYNNGNYSNGNYNNNYGGGYGNGNFQPYQPSQLDLEEPVKMSEWLISLLLMLVPCVNIIMMFVWAFSKTEKKSKSNFFKAQLIMTGILFVLYLVLLIFAVAIGLTY